MGCIAYEDSFYLVGGYNEKKPLSSLEKCTPLTGRIQVSKLAPMKHARGDLGCCVGFDRRIYAVGGVSNSNSILNSCERYNFDKGTWEALPSMNSHRRGCVLIALPHGVVVVGGHSGQKTLNEVEIFEYERG